ncbi:glycosyltransferase [Ferruginibacter paludis]|uniref:glycosyltransferase n=1 Tax=Ferruginibacter paludis TaxID=1310417 RepID=UPI0025B50AC1|nr:glycosyltransferase [Ferruginibacter paludis]MDN3658171.1 glycosyltransferase [Ferruginibacter paludis]
MEKDIKNCIQTGSISTSPDRRISVLEIVGSSTRGGMENYIVNFIKNLPADKFRIICICPNESWFTTALRGLGVEAVFITPIADDPEWRSIQMVMEVARLYHVDILHAHMPKSHVLAGIAGSLLNKPVVATVHGMHVTAYELGVALAVKSHLVTNCQETFIQALALGVPADRVNLFHNGVDINVFAPGRQGQELRNRIGVPTTATLVGFVGRLEHEKGPDLFLRAAWHVHATLPGVQFVIVGAGSMRKHLVQMGQQMAMESCLHFVDWSEDTADMYPALDLLVHSSRNDGTSLVLMEAMACGRPVVGMAVGGVREVIENEHTGMLVEKNDWEAMGNQIVSLLEQPELLKQMGTAGRRRVEDHFNVVENTRKTAALLKQVATSSNLQSTENNFQLTETLNGNGSLNGKNK